MTWLWVSSWRFDLNKLCLNHNHDLAKLKSQIISFGIHELILKYESIGIHDLILIETLHA